MKTFSSPVIAILFLVSGLISASGGQALVGPIKGFVDNAALVVVVDVKKVTEVTVSTGNDLTSIVYVAEADVLQTLKSDHTPTPLHRKIAIVGSTIPMSSAVWQPIVKGRYLAFLNPEQGHYRYGEKYDMRPIRPENKVQWIEKNAKGDYELFELDLEEAIKRTAREIGVSDSAKPNA